MGDTGAISSTTQTEVVVLCFSDARSVVSGTAILDVEQLDGDRAGVEQTVAGTEEVPTRDFRSPKRREMDDRRVCARVAMESICESPDRRFVARASERTGRR